MDSIFYIKNNVEVSLIPSLVECMEPKLIFGSTGGVVAIGKINEFGNINMMVDDSIGSAPWISEDSDYFRFDKNGEFHSMVLKIPARNNIVIAPPLPNNGFYSIGLNCNTLHFSIEPQRYRYFDYLARELYSFSTLTEHSIKKEC